MHKRILQALATAVLTVLVCSAPLARAQAVSRFNLPAQPLAESLRAVASQTDTDLLFDPPLVAGRQAPALKADLTVDGALVRLLAGTGIRHEFLNEKTVVLTAGSAVPEPSQTGAALATPQTKQPNTAIRRTGRTELNGKTAIQAGANRRRRRFRRYRRPTLRCAQG